jgi:hypothetical protein
VINRQINLNITGAVMWDDAYWLTKPSKEPMFITWKDRFIHKYVHDNKLLSEVESESGVIDDETGNRTIAAIPNNNGIVKFKVTYNIDSSGGIRTTPQDNWQEFGLKDSFEFTETPDDGQTIIFFIMAYDVFGNTVVSYN